MMTSFLPIGFAVEYTIALLEEIDYQIQRIRNIPYIKSNVLIKLNSAL